MNAEGVEQSDVQAENDGQSRVRKMTEKGARYRRELLENNIAKTFKKIKSISRKIDGAVAENADTEPVRLLYSEWLVACDDFYLCCDNYNCLYGDDVSAESFDDKFVFISDFKAHILRWMTSREKQSKLSYDDHDYGNVTSQFDSHAFRSRGSSRGSSRDGGSSVASSIMSAKLKAEQKRAAIMARAASLKAKHELDYEKMKIQMKEEELKLQTDLAVANAENNVLINLDSEQNITMSHELNTKLNPSVPLFIPRNSSNVSGFPCNNPGISANARNSDPHSVCNQAKNVPGELLMALNNPGTQNDVIYAPTNVSGVPFNGAHIEANVSNVPGVPINGPHMPQNNQSNVNVPNDSPACNHNMSPYAMESIVKNLRKPPPEIKPFSGNPMDYRKFVRQFKNRIVNNSQDDDEKMGYLEQFTSDEAYRIVSGFSYLDASHGYPAALHELDQRYGNDETLANAFIKKALEWPVVKADNAKALDDFGIFLVECENAVHGISAVKVLEFPDNMRKLVAKLPFHLHDKWRTVVQRTRSVNGLVEFSQLVKFVKDEAKRINDPTYGKDALRSETMIYGSKNQHSTHSASRKSSFTTSVEHVDKSESEVKPNNQGNDKSKHGENAFSKPCIFCNKSSHCLATCFEFRKLRFKERIDFLRRKGVCFSCLKKGHQRKDCKNKATCEICKKSHPTVCHIDFNSRSDVNGTLSSSKPGDPPTDGHSSFGQCESSEVVSSCMGAGDGQCTLAIIPVTVWLKDRLQVITTYAFFDPGSSVSFCSERLISKLGGHGRSVKIRLDTMGSSHTLNTYAIKGLHIGDLKMENQVDLPKVYTKDRIPVSHSHIPTNKDIHQWSHLNDVHLPQIQGDIELMIGNNVPDAFTPSDVRTGPCGTPHATKTRLGWVVWNVIRANIESPESKCYPNFSVNRVEATRIHEFEQLEQLVKQSIQIDFPERVADEQKEHSVEDKEFLRKTDESIVLIDGHYQIDLPFREKDVVLPNNYLQAFQRLKGLKKKMEGNPKFREDYKLFMFNILLNGYAEEVPPKELVKPVGKVWYIPHHGVYHPKKPDKVRVVFDCTASYQGVSLNSLLLQGPDLTNGLMGVLLRFRQENVAIMGDVESMFYQVKVAKSDCDYLRFLWWPNGDINQDPVEHRMLVHLFGAVSSPSCANKALSRTFEDNMQDFDVFISDTAKSNFYVDDCLSSVSTEDEAVTLINGLSALAKRGGFKLSKWVSNSHNVIASIPVEDRNKNLQELNLTCDLLPNERALGVYWLVESDSLGFRIQLVNQTATRRSILSTVSAVYDPLGLISPFVLVARILLQRLCKSNIGWDDDISGVDLRKWQEWVSDLLHLDCLEVSRCYKPHDFGNVKLCQLHMFSDASEDGYGIAAYLRMINDKDECHCCLVMGKARVAPLKKITIPRMELTAAVISVRLSKVLMRELSYHVDNVYFWTDSMSVLRYISNTTSRFHTFVANRISVIHDGTEIDQWRYVDSKSNPADAASRGLTLSKLLQNNNWFSGPQFLWKSETEWPSANESHVISPDPEFKVAIDPEVKVVHTTLMQPSSMDVLISRCSSWWRLCRVVGWIIMFLQAIRRRINQKPCAQKLCVEDTMCSESAAVCSNIKVQTDSLNLSTEVLSEAEHHIVRYVQHQHFSEEVLTLESGGKIKRSSPIYKLDVILVDGIIRVGGRLARSNIPYECKHQIVLPGKSLVSKLIIEHVHKSVGHMGKNIMLSKLQEKYWILGASSVIKSLLCKCVICRKYRGCRGEQKMADLPADRLISNEPPFSRVGMDFFGPFEVCRGRSVVKRYGVVFTCLAIRAVHLEIAHSLDTDSCLNAIRRFICRRGSVKVIRSDNGTNLVSSERTLREAIQKWNQSQIIDALLQHQIKWEFNPPSASHFGGVWERIIRSVRKVLYSLLQQQVVCLDDEGLQTLFCEVESILNARPITCVPTDINEYEALTPNHLLLQQSGSSLPPGNFSKEDNFVRRKWRQIQYLSDVFWSRWVKEYLPLLQVRQKWHHPRRNLAVGDIVMLMDSSVRNSWCYGRVIEVVSDSKGFVRSVNVKAKTGTFRRPVDKLCLLLECDN